MIEPPAQNEITKMPDAVILYGALRSGTTMLRLMLDAHPALSCPGESDFLFDHLRAEADTWRYDRRKMALDQSISQVRWRYLTRWTEFRPLS